MKHLTLLVGLLLLTQICLGQDNLKLIEGYEGARLAFSRGGGITGAFQQYWILQNGQLFLSKNGGEFIELPKVKRRKARKLFKSAEKMDLLNFSFDKPGNISYSIAYFKGGEHSKVSWGIEKDRSNPALAEFFSEFSALISKSKSGKASSN